MKDTAPKLDKKEVEKRFTELEKEYNQSVKFNRSRGTGLGF